LKVIVFVCFSLKYSLINSDTIQVWPSDL